MKIQTVRNMIGWLMLAASALFLVYWTPIIGSQIGEMLQDGGSIGIDERLTEVKPDKASWLLEQSGGRWGRYGWHLAAGEKGIVRIALPGSDKGVLKLRLWAYNPGQLSVQIDDGSLSNDLRELSGGLVELTVQGKSQLIVNATNAASEDQLVLDRIAVSWSPSHVVEPSLLPIAVVIFFILGGWGLLCDTAISRRLWLGSTIIIVIAFTGMLIRWSLFDLQRLLPLRPDTVSYVNYAHSMKWFTSDHGFYSGSFSQREPLFVALLNIWFLLVGDGHASPMLLTVLLSTFLIVLSGYFAWHLSGRWYFGAVTSLVMAVNPAVVTESVQGLRTEFEIMMFLIVLGVWLWGKGRAGTLLMGIAIGVSSLLLAPEGLYVFIPLIWFCWLFNYIRKKRGKSPISPAHWNFRQLLAASLLAVFLYVPHLYGLYRVHGDPSWPTQVYARWLANVEFPDRLGTPGFPTREEFAQSSYAGPPISIGEYFFGLHSIPKLIKGQVKGWILSNAYMSVSFTPHIVEYVFLYSASGYHAVLRHLNPLSVAVFLLALSLTFIGWIDLWRRREYWWIPFLTFWGTWFTVYVYSARLVEPFRHTAYVYPLLAFCMLWGGLKVFEHVSKKVGKKT